MADSEDAKKARLIAAILRRDVLPSGPFESMTDLADALKTRCARLRIGATPEQINAACDLVASNRELTTITARLERVPMPPRPLMYEPPVFSAAEASEMVRRLRAAVERESR